MLSVRCSTFISLFYLLDRPVAWPAAGLTSANYALATPSGTLLAGVVAEEALYLLCFISLGLRSRRHPFGDHIDLQPTDLIQMNIALGKGDDDAGPTKFVVNGNMKLIRNSKSFHRVIDKDPQLEIEAVVSESQK